MSSRCAILGYPLTVFKANRKRSSFGVEQLCAPRVSHLSQILGQRCHILKNTLAI